MNVITDTLYYIIFDDLASELLYKSSTSVAMAARDTVTGTSMPTVIVVAGK